MKDAGTGSNVNVALEWSEQQPVVGAGPGGTSGAGAGTHEHFTVGHGGAH